MIDWEEYSNKMKKILAMRDHDSLDEEDRQTNGFPPQDDIQLRHELITPSDPIQLINKNLRTGNLSNIESMAVRKAGLFATWISHIKGTYNIGQDKNLLALEDELKDDIAIVLNLSTSKKGWLIDNILNPKKKYQFTGERGEKRAGLFQKREEND